MASQERFEHPRVLVVEDEFLIALDLAETVRALGCRVDGPHVAQKTALAAIEQAMPDCAILDVMVEDGEVFPLADKLQQAGIPILFHSGHADPKELCQRYPQAKAAQKPCPPAELVEFLTNALNSSRH